MCDPWGLVTGILEEVLAVVLRKLPEERVAAEVLEELLIGFLEVPAESLMEEKEAAGESAEVATARCSSSSSPSMFSPGSPLPQPPRHPPPNSQDFLFYRGIERDRPSSADPEEEWAGLSPPPELLWSPGPASPSPLPASWSGQSSSPAKGSPLFRRTLRLAPSCGVTLRPLSQAEPGGREPPVKRSRLEEPKAVTEQLQTSSQHLEASSGLEDSVGDRASSQASEGDGAALPLTFHSKVDLLWKLQRADLLPGREAAPSQRPGRGDRHVKEEQLQDGEPSQGGEEESYTRPEEQEAEREQVVEPAGPPAGDPRAVLLHRAPRVGLSKLARVRSIHDIVIVKEE